MKSDTCREKLKGKREVYRRSDGRQEFAILYSQRNFTGSQWSSFSSGVIWSRFRFFFFQNEPSCTVLNSLQSTYLFRRQTGSDRVAVIKARGNQSGD